MNRITDHPVGPMHKHCEAVQAQHEKLGGPHQWMPSDKACIALALERIAYRLEVNDRTERLANAILNAPDGTYDPGTF